MCSQELDLEDKMVLLSGEVERFGGGVVGDPVQAVTPGVPEHALL